MVLGRLKRRKLRKILIAQFETNINKIYNDCLKDCEGDESGSVVLETYNKAIKSVLVTIDDANEFKISYNFRMNAMYQTAKNIAEKNNLTRVSMINIRTTGRLALKKYIEYIELKLK